jgi:microcystin-dependent protein
MATCDLFFSREVKYLKIMSTFVGEIKLFAGYFAPRGWFSFHGQILQMEAPLASLHRSYFRGDCIVTFGLPDLRGRVTESMGHGKGLTLRLCMNYIINWYGVYPQRD